MAFFRTIGDGATPNVIVELTYAEAQTMLCLCQAVRGSKIKSRKVHTDAIVDGLSALGVAPIPKIEFHGLPQFRANKCFDIPYDLAILPLTKL